MSGHGVAGISSCWNQDGTVFTAVNNPINGIAAMWMLMPIAGGLVAFIIDWLVSIAEHSGRTLAAGRFSGGKHSHIAAPAAGAAPAAQPAARSASGRRTAAPAASAMAMGNNVASLQAPLNPKVW
jgi:hypothetical protein